MLGTNNAPVNTYSFRDLTVWRTRLPDVRFAVLPPSNTRPNPLVVQDRVFVSVFAPGAICTLDREHGKLIWRRRIGKFAGASVYLRGPRLFATSCNTLFAMNSESGKVIWSFCPCGTDRESIYSSPAESHDRVFIGDRSGRLHCLDAANGKIIWTRLANSARNSNVNSTPVVLDGQVIITTNAKTAMAYDIFSGKLAWRQKLDGPSGFGPLLLQSSVVAVANSVYELNVRGTVHRHLEWRGEQVYVAEVTPRKIVVSFWPKTAERSDKTEFRQLTFVDRKSGSQRSLSFSAFCASFRYAASSGLLYASHLNGVDILHPDEGTLLCKLKTKRDSRGGMGLVDVDNDKIYVLSGDGSVFALQHPRVGAH
ncbi:MAG TPA: PQQ-binding-like beta-propeller repeat protein [Terriglobales bacterium]|jgi:outer membrane protein assembly factor BamB